MEPFQFEIARFLASKAKQRQRTTYQELAAAVGWAHPTGRGLGKNLYAVLHYMHDMKLPPLTTILVRKGHRYPDNDALGYIHEVIGDIEIADAQEEVFAYDWSSVPDSVRSQMGFLVDRKSGRHRSRGARLPTTILGGTHFY